MLMYVLPSFSALDSNTTFITCDTVLLVELLVMIMMNGNEVELFAAFFSLLIEMETSEGVMNFKMEHANIQEENSRIEQKPAYAQTTCNHCFCLVLVTQCIFPCIDALLC